MMIKCQFIFKLLLLVIIPVTFGITDSFSTKTLKDACGNTYENVDGLHLVNQEQDWKSSSNNSNSQIKLNNCNITIRQATPSSNTNNSTSNNQEQYSFLIKFDYSNLCSNENYNKLMITIQTNSNNNQQQQENLCKLFNQTNYLTVNSTSLNILLYDNNNNNVNYPFQAFEHLIITSFLYVNNSGNCKDGSFKCQSPSTVCLDNKFKCDNVKSCSDGSDETNCQVATTTPLSPAQNQTSSTQTTTQSVKETNFTTTALIENANKHLNKFNFLIAAVVILSVVIIVLGAIWLYGRRKRRWREFLAQLDNNTDWEYEQLDDGPAISASRTTMTPIFNLNVSNDYGRSGGGGGSNGGTSLRENTNTNLMSSSTANNTSNSNTNRGNINERTPITIPS